MRCSDRAKCGLLLGILFLAVHRPARAETVVSCAAAMDLIADHPGIEAGSLLTEVAAEWRAMNQATLSAGHPALTGQMLSMPGVMNQLSRQCANNPGQSLRAAAAQVYLRARAALDGF